MRIVLNGLSDVLAAVRAAAAAAAHGQAHGPRARPAVHLHREGSGSRCRSPTRGCVRRCGNSPCSAARGPPGGRLRCWPACSRRRTSPWPSCPARRPARGCPRRTRAQSPGGRPAPAAGSCRGGAHRRRRPVRPARRRRGSRPREAGAGGSPDPQLTGAAWRPMRPARWASRRISVRASWSGRERTPRSDSPDGGVDDRVRGDRPGPLQDLGGNLLRVGDDPFGHQPVVAVDEGGGRGARGHQHHRAGRQGADLETDQVGPQ